MSLQRKGTSEIPKSVDPVKGTFITDTKMTPSRLSSPSNIKGYDRGKFEHMQNELSKFVDGLESKISNILSKQEQDYISSFKYYIGEKEEEISRLYDRLRTDEKEMKKNEDKKIKQLESYSEAKKKESEYLAEMCKIANKDSLVWKSKVLNLASDCSFLEKKIKSIMKEVKVLRYFIMQIDLFLEEQLSLVENKETHHEEEEHTSHNLVILALKNLLSGIRKFNQIGDIEQIDDGFEHLGNAMFKKDSDTGSLKKKNGLRSRQERKGRQSISIQEKEVNKFVGSEETKEFLIKEMQTRMDDIETKYKDTLSMFKKANERQEKEIKLLKKNAVMGKMKQNDLERIFMSCVEEGRREIYKRKLKTLQSPMQKKTGVSDSEQDITQIELLTKIGALKQRRISYDNFTALDKLNILSLFVSNEFVIQKIHEHMFPNKVSDYDKMKEKELYEKSSSGIDLDRSSPDIVLSPNQLKGGAENFLFSAPAERSNNETIVTGNPKQKHEHVKVNRRKKNSDSPLNATLPEIKHFTIGDMLSAKKKKIEERVNTKKEHK